VVDSHVTRDDDAREGLHNVSKPVAFSLGNASGAVLRNAERSSPWRFEPRSIDRLVRKTVAHLGMFPDNITHGL